MRELLRVVVTGVVLLAGLSTGALAQTDASVSGTVTDSTAEVTAVNQTTNAAMTVFTAQLGITRSPVCPPGSMR